jgi:hypothetical protein
MLDQSAISLPVDASPPPDRQTSPAASDIGLLLDQAPVDGLASK